MADKIYIPLSQYLEDTLIPADLVTSSTPGFLEYIAFDDGHIFVDGTNKNARLQLTVMKALEVEFISGVKVGIGEGKAQVEFVDNEDEWSLRASIEKLHFEIAILNIQQDVSTMLYILKTADIQEYEFSLENLVIGSFTATEITVGLVMEENANSGSITFNMSWDIIKNRLQALPSNVPKPDNDETIIETLVEWDESDASKTVHVNLKVELAELANAFFDFLPEDVRPDVLSWQLGIDTVYEGQGNTTGYDAFQEDTSTSQLTGDIYASIELQLPEKLSNISTDAFEVRFGDSSSIIRAHLAINGINSGDTKFHFDIEDLVSVIIYIDKTPGAEPLKIFFSRFSLDKATGTADIKLEGHFIYGNLKGSSSFEFSVTPTTTSWKGDLVLGYYLDGFQVETELHIDFGKAQTSTDPVTVDDNSANIQGKISFSKIKIGNDDIFVKLVDASFGFDYSRKAGKPSFKIQAGIDLLFQLSTQGLDGFLAKVLPATPVQFSFQKQFEWNMDKKAADAPPVTTPGGQPTTPGGPATPAAPNVLQSLQQHTTSQRASGGLNMSFLISIQKDILGVIRIESIEESIALAVSGITNTLVLNAGVKIGPLSGAITGIGVAAEFNWKSPQKNLGFVDLRPSIVGPSGIGLVLDTSAVKAGGFLLVKPDEYIGALELEIKSIKLAIKAIAIINTKLPGGVPGFSLLVIITAEFSPIQLGYGFSLNGLGGLFGYKRSFESDELRLGLKTKTLDSILFPKNVIANITQIVGDLKRVFPMGNNFLIGPMVKIGWGTSLVTAEIGILIQVPEPIIIAILGVIRVELPEPGNTIVKLQINFLGIIDFEKKMLSLDATLTGSRILTFTLTGDFAVRLGWGSPAVFIFSSGGFHPDFKEAPVELQHMERLGIQIINEADVKLGVGCYFALTTNTVQIGAAAKFWAKSGDYIALAEVGFDALIQFKPFFFSIAIYLTGRVTGPMIDIVIEVKGNLSGPNPWHVWGHAHAKLLFFEITIPFDKTFGEPIEELSLELQNVLSLLMDEVPKNTNWKTSTVISAASKVSLREIKPGPDNMIVHPNTVLSFNQRVVPLGVTIQKFGNKGIDGDKQFSVSASIVGNNVPVILDHTLNDSFAPGNFFEIGKDQKLSRPSFEQMKSGKEFTLGPLPAAGALPVTKDIDYEIIYIRKKKSANEGVITFLNPGQVILLASGGAAAKSKLSAENNRVSYQAPPKITINRPGYNIVKKTNLEVIKQPGITPETYGNQTEAYNKQLEFEENETLILSTLEI